MTTTLLRRRAALITGAALLATPRLARAAWPERPVRIIVAFPPGSSTDVVARALAMRLETLLGHAVPVENRGGAGGNIGTQAVKGATDGHTLLMHSTAFCVNPSLYRAAGYGLDDQAVTIRERDTMAQSRIALDQVESYLAQKLLGC